MTIDVEFHTNYDIAELAAEWQELESRARPSFFLSWAWMGCWLAQTGARPILVRARQASDSIALGFLARNERRRHGLHIVQFRLNETGIDDHDRLTIEHNGFLVASDANDEVLERVFSQMQRTPALGDWDEIVLSGVPPKFVGAVAAAGLKIETDRSSADYRVDLSTAQSDGTDWLSRRSANLRAQLRQARAAAERLGPVTLSAARSVSEALTFFDGLREMHDRYWRSKNQVGAFDTEFARRFHRALISAHTDDGQVELLRLTAGREALGYLYNFVGYGTVYNYQGGFTYSEDNRNRPGLLGHAMAIERAISRGSRVYDFLAGDASYKARFGENAGSLIWCRAQRDRPGLVVEGMARRAKHTVVRLLRRR